MKKWINITKEVNFENNDDESLPITKCKCGHIFEPWHFIISIYDEDPYECPECGCKMFFRNKIKIYEVKDKD